jgi:hypothetical protein
MSRRKIEKELFPFKLSENVEEAIFQLQSLPSLFPEFSCFHLRLKRIEDARHLCFFGEREETEVEINLRLSSDEKREAGERLLREAAALKREYDAAVKQ